MARLYNITDGAARTIDVIDITTPGIIASRGGFGTVKVNPHDYDAKIVERWKLNLWATSHDNAATQLAALNELLWDAWRYHNDPSYITPIYITQQTTNETGTRYALIYDAPEITQPDYFNHPFEADNIIEEMGVAVVRGPWRSGAPGVKGSALTLTASDGPANQSLVHISNYRDDHAIDTIFRLDQGVVWQADFEMTDPDRMWIADNAALSAGNIDFFIAGRIKLESIGTAMMLVGKWDGVIANEEYLLYYDTAANRLAFWISDGAGLDSVTANSFGPLAINTEYFVCCWHIAATSEIGIQINDVAPDTGVSARFPQDGACQFTLGGQQGGGAGFDYDGTLYSWGVWKAECTAALRACLYNSGVPKFFAELTAAELAGLQAYWEFGSAGLAFVNDSQGANHLANVGAAQIVGTAQAWSANQIAIANHNLFPAAPAVGDCYYIGSEESFFNIVWNLVTAGIYTVTLAYEYSRACSWGAMTLGDDLTLYPDDDPWNQLGQVLVNWAGASDWAKILQNGQTKFWIRIRITSFVAMGTIPANGTYVVYNQRTPYIEIPSTALKGDIPPYLMLRMRSPAGGDDNPEMATNSRAIIGAKSRGLTKFVSHLNCGGDGNPGDWVVSVADPPCKDASIVADGSAPGGDRVDVSFATDATMMTRVQLSGTAILDSWLGKYRVFLRAEQVGGNAGDIEVQLRTFINSTEDYAPKYDTETIALKGVDNGMEMIEITPGDLLQLPFSEIEGADILTNADLIFHVQARRTVGASTLRIFDLILIPADEWATEFDDPLSDQLTGNSALRGLTLLDDDGGIISDRTIKQLIDGANIYLAETWSRHGDRAKIKPAKQTRFYFLFMHYPSGGIWGVAPLIGTLGMHLTFELFAQNCYLFLRGSS